MKNNYVYMHLCKINGAIYFEQKPNDYCQRFEEAVEKYGWNNFWHMIIKDNLTLEEAKELKEQLIRDYEY